MSDQSRLDDSAAEQALAKLLERHEQKGLLRFITCGSVDDGKSTLIGRLLYETDLLMEDQLESLAADSRRSGTQGEELDLALLLDGLAAEREQGITIDVAYRYFATERRKFIVADTPGHEQYTRNMATGASTADCAVILVDASKGLLSQTRRHSHIVALLGLRHVILAVNKMDLVGFAESPFRQIESDYHAFAAELGLADVSCVPLSALSGDNVVSKGSLPWYDGPTLLELLETVEVDQRRSQEQPLRLPVQWVNRPSATFRGFSGTLAAGAVAPGDRVVTLPSGQETTVTRVLGPDGDLAGAVAGQAVTVALADEIDVSRGDLLAAASAPAEVGRQFEATLIWMADEPLLPGREYLIRIGTKSARATVAPLKHKLDIESGTHIAAERLELNEIGVVEIELDQSVAFDPYAHNRDTGGVILIDRVSDATVACGMLSFALRRSANVTWQSVTIDPSARAQLKRQRPFVVWLTGLSGAGKSTIADLLEQRLYALGHHTFLLDGDNLRHGLNKDLGFTAADRVENVRRAGEVCRLLADAGLIVLAAFVSPFRAERRAVRALFPDGDFVEAHVDAPLALLEQRDSKGLYAKARRGELGNLTGVGQAYEPPEAPDIYLDMAELDAGRAAEQIITLLRARGLLENR